MISVTAPTRLVFIGNCKIAKTDMVRYCCLCLEGDSRLVNDNLFIDDPNTSAHEHYLVHGKLSGGLTIGGDGLANYSGKSVFQRYNYGKGSIICSDMLYSGNNKGDYYPPDSEAYCFLNGEVDHHPFAILYMISYQNDPSYRDAPYWVYSAPFCCASQNSKYSYQYDFYDLYGVLPGKRFYSSLNEAFLALQAHIRTITLGRIVKTSSIYSDDSIFYGENTFDVSKYDIGRLPNIKNFFKFNEFNWVPTGSPFGLQDSYSFQHLRQLAFWNSVQDVKALNQNTITSIVEAIQFLIKVKSGKFSLKDIIPESLSNLWLQYRYQYSTTKSDVEEALEFIEWSGVFSQKDTFFVRGISSYNGVKCICKTTIRNRFLSEAKQWWTKLYKYGLQPNFYVVWDFTPFSFIVDWFLPVGDLCSIIDGYNNFTDSYDCVNVVYSLSYGAEVWSGGVTLQASLYSRWVENHFPPCEFCYLYEGNNPSDKTILFRCLDAVSLIIGRKRG